MSALKNFLKYIGIVLGLCLGVVLVVMAGMILFKFELFGFQYFSTNIQNKDYILIDANNKQLSEQLKGYHNGQVMEKITRITVNSNNIDVFIRPYKSGLDNDGGPQIGPYKIVPMIKASGFARLAEGEPVAVFNVKLNEFKNEDNNKNEFELVVNVGVPSGLITTTYSYVTIFTPFFCNYVFDGHYQVNGELVKFDKTPGFDTFKSSFDDHESKHNKIILDKITVNANKGNVTIHDAVKGQSFERYAKATIYAKNIDVTTTSGTQTYDRVGIENIKAVSSTGNIEFKNLTNHCIPGNSKSLLTVKNDDGEDINPQIYLSSDRGTIKFFDGVDIGKNYESNSPTKTICNIRGELCQLEINSLINTNFYYIGNSDKITIKSAIYSLLNIQSNNAHINIGSIFSESDIELTYNQRTNKDNKNGYRKINIGYIETSQGLTLDTWTGDITIGTLITFGGTERPSILTTGSGDIKVNNLIGSVKTDTNSGNINIHQSDSFINMDNPEGKPAHLVEPEDLYLTNLATRIVNSEYSAYLKSKEIILQENEELKKQDVANNDDSYLDMIESSIDKLKLEIANIKAEMQAKINTYKQPTNIADRYNEIMRFNSIIEIKSKSGKVVLENLIANKVTTTISGTSSITAQFKEINGKEHRISTSGGGKLNLYIPEDKLYLVYQEAGNAQINDNLLGLVSGNFLNQAQCRASYIKADTPATEPTYLIGDGEGQQSLQSVFDTTGINFCLTIANFGNGQNSVHKTSTYKK